MSNPPPGWSVFVETRVLASGPAAVDQRIVVLEPPEGFLDAYTRPGQYCRVRMGGGEGYFALLSTPAERELRFLVRSVGIGRELASLAVGAPVELTAPSGPGFDLEAAAERDLVFAASGTGIGPIRPAIETVLERRGGREMSLYYGVWDPERVAVSAELERWAARGVRIRMCCSRDEPGHFVQDAIAADAPDVERSAFVVAGRPEMVEGITAWVRDQGGSERWVLRNF